MKQSSLKIAMVNKWFFLQLKNVFKYSIGILLLIVLSLVATKLNLIQAITIEECNLKKEDDGGAYTRCLNDMSIELQGKIANSQQQAQTLTNAINIINTQAQLQQIQIAQTQNEINLLEKELTNLNERINGLSLSLDRLTQILIVRSQAAYKLTRTSPMIALFTSNNFPEFISQLRYLQEAEKQIARAMQEAENQRLLYNEQKNLKEVKQAQLEEKRAELETQKKELERNKNSKQKLLAETKNDESTYQQLLKIAQDELRAIKAISAGEGSEKIVGEVMQGDKIATLISGRSCNSSGTHLHFMIKKDEITQNPFNYLQNIEHEAYDDPFNPSGSWSWPLEAKIRLTQGYGESWATKNTWVRSIYKFHDGIDIVSTTSNNVLATHDGILSHGSYSGNCTLQYVKIKNEETQIETLYLHVNY